MTRSAAMPPSDGRFPPTRWTLVSRIRCGDEQVARGALDELCSQYYYPLYCYIRRKGLTHHDAEDALQEFMAKLLRNDSMSAARAAKGRLRGLLCTALERYLVNWRRNHAKESLETSIEAESEHARAAGRFLREKFTDEETPERLFERQWAREMLNVVLRKLEAFHAQGKKHALFKALKPHLLEDGNLSGAEAERISTLLGMTLTSICTAKSRMKKEYRELLRAEVAQTVEREEDVDDELAYLMSLFRRQDK